MAQDLSSLFGVELKVINVGLSLFAESLRDQGIAVAEVNWRPPAGGDMALLELLDRLGRGDQEEDADGE